jgi:hypothetical protein
MKKKKKRMGTNLSQLGKHQRWGHTIKYLSKDGSDQKVPKRNFAYTKKYQNKKVP